MKRKSGLKKSLKTAAIEVKGIVQGVGFRPFIHRLAKKYSLTGRVINRTGSVSVEVSGNGEEIKKFYKDISLKKPGPAEIAEITLRFVKTRKIDGFTIKKSETSTEPKFIPPDIPTCSACLSEFNDESNRRYHYPFINCTCCGPRFTIINDTPYDRAKTSMNMFKMCAACLDEYKNINDRRYHAEPNACPVCGPEACLADSKGRIIATKDLFKTARTLLKQGKIGVLKGLGGFHIAVDAKNSRAIEKLKMRKKRSNKPFAIMSDSMEKIRRFACVSIHSEQLLESAEAPIVLLPLKKNRLIYHGITGGLKHIGVFMPYTPLHYLLFDNAITALVMTSANLSEEPIQYDNAEAVKTLGGIADFFILHNRKIVIPADDSVIKPYNKNRTIIIRRSRGFVPAPIFFKRTYPEVIGIGGLLKNTSCFLQGNRAIMSQHIGDLENDSAYDYFVSTIERFSKFFNMKPRAIACDLHPDYLSARYAEKYAFENKILLVKVQHHYAHMLSVMAEHNHYDRSLGVIMDGAGYGDDGNIWGGEFLTGDFNSYKRAAHFKYLNVAGGDMVSRHPYRSAISMLSEFLEGRKISSKYQAYSPAGIQDAIKKNINTTLTSGAGRFFDAAASTLGICHISTYDSEAPMKLEAAAFGIKPQKAYKYEIEEKTDNFQLNMIPAFKELWGDKNNPKAAANFHFTVAKAIFDMIRTLAERERLNTVILSGGVFQNTVLLEMLLKHLKKTGYNVLMHEKLSPNDSSIALGQAVYAANKIMNSR